jgi:hypothetical protein
MSTFESICERVAREIAEQYEQDVKVVEESIISDPSAYLDYGSLLRLFDKQNRRAGSARTNRGRTKNLWESGWGKLILHPDVNTKGSYHNRVFRRRFRLPFPVFRDLVQDCKEHNVFNSRREGKIAVEFKVLIGLRILGRDNCCDDIDEYLNIGMSTVNYIFKAFCFGCNTKLYNQYVKVPEGEALDRVERVYARYLLSSVTSTDQSNTGWHYCIPSPEL